MKIRRTETGSLYHSVDKTNLHLSFGVDKTCPAFFSRTASV